MVAVRPRPILVLSRADVLDLLSLRDCIEAVERTFRLHAEGVRGRGHRRGLWHAPRSTSSRPATARRRSPVTSCSSIAK